MRAFASVPPTIWQAEVKRLRGDTEAIAVLFHLLTSQHSSMIGVYPLAIGYMAHDLGTPFEGASKALQRVCEAGLATYDEERELVWVHDMALAQVATRLAPKDNRVTSIAKQLVLLPICQITLSFYGQYREIYHLTDHPIMAEFERAFIRGFEGASEGLRSKKKDKNQNKDLEEEPESFGFRREENFQSKRESSFTSYPIPPSAADARSFLISKNVPQSQLDECVQLMMGGNFSPYDLEGVLAKRDAA